MSTKSDTAFAVIAAVVLGIVVFGFALNADDRSRPVIGNQTAITN